MSYLPVWLAHDIVRDLGWTLIDFLWQGLLLATMLHTILPICGGARTRHNWAFGTLAAMVVAPVMTFLFLHSNGGGSASLAVFSGTFARGIGVTTDMLTPTSTASPWINWLVVFWIAGIAILSLRALGGWYLAETLRRRDTLALPTDLLQQCHAMQQRLGLAWPVLFRQSHRVTVPIVVGWFRPVVLIPISVITGLAPQQLDALIMHELAHIRRLDAFTNIMLIAAETMLFYHPAVWWVTRRVRVEREHCCDDFAVSICGDASMYVEALTSLETWKAVPVRVLASNGGRLNERVARLLGVPSCARGFSTTVGLAFLCLIVAAGIATAQNNATTSIPGFAIRIVDGSVEKNARQGPPGEDRVRTSTTDKNIPAALWLKRDGQIVGGVLADAHAGAGRNGEPVVEFTLTPEGRDQFAALTRANIGHSLAVVVNGTIVTVPVVKEPMIDGKGEISGHFTESQAGALAVEMMGTKPPASP